MPRSHRVSCTWIIGVKALSEVCERMQTSARSPRLESSASRDEPAFAESHAGKMA